jgi:hypothetical protein
MGIIFEERDTNIVTFSRMGGVGAGSSRCFALLLLIASLLLFVRENWCRSTHDSSYLLLL